MLRLDGVVDPVGVQLLRARIQAVRSIQTELSLRASSNKNGTLVEQVVRTLALDPEQHTNYIQNSLRAIDHAEESLNRLLLAPQQNSAIEAHFQGVKDGLARTSHLSQQHAVYL